MDLVFTLQGIHFIDYQLLYRSGFKGTQFQNTLSRSAGTLMLLLCRGHSQFVNTPLPLLSDNASQGSLLLN